MSSTVLGAWDTEALQQKLSQCHLLHRSNTGKCRFLQGAQRMLKIKSWLPIFAHLVTLFFFFFPIWKASIFLSFLWFQKTILGPHMCCIITSHVHNQRGTTVTEYNGFSYRWVWNQPAWPNESVQEDLLLAAPKESTGIIYKTTLSPIKCGSFISEAYTYSYKKGHIGGTSEFAWWKVSITGHVQI